MADGGWHVARLTNPAAMAELANDHSPEWRGLAVSVLHVLAENKLVPTDLALAEMRQYVDLLREVTDAAAGQRRQLARWSGGDNGHVEQIAGHLEKMLAEIEAIFTRNCSPGCYSIR